MKHLDKKYYKRANEILNKNNTPMPNFNQNSGEVGAVVADAIITKLTPISTPIYEAEFRRQVEAGKIDNQTPEMLRWKKFRGEELKSFVYL